MATHRKKQLPKRKSLSNCGSKLHRNVACPSPSRATARRSTRCTQHDHAPPHQPLATLARKPSINPDQTGLLRRFARCLVMSRSRRKTPIFWAYWCRNRSSVEEGCCAQAAPPEEAAPCRNPRWRPLRWSPMGPRIRLVFGQGRQMLVGWCRCEGHAQVVVKGRPTPAEKAVSSHSPQTAGGIRSWRRHEACRPRSPTPGPSPTGRGANR